MIVYHLALFICLSVDGPTGDLAQKTCRWESTGRYFQVQAACEAYGEGEGGRPRFSDQVIIGARGEIKRHRCNPVQVQ